MAINKEKTKNLMIQMEKLVETLIKPLPEDGKKYVRDVVFGEAFKAIKETIQDSRAPRLFLVGRSGHGKSTLLNALARKEVAQINHVTSCTPESVPYEISFSDRYANWTVIDSRGIFESIKPDGAVEDNAIEVLTADLIRYKPDVIMHVISMTEIRSMENDLIAFKDIYQKVKKAIKRDIPCIMVLNKADIIGNPRHWPPEDYPNKKGMIKEALDYMVQILEIENFELIDYNNPIKGYNLHSDKYLSIIPVCSEDYPVWNMETLSDYIGEHLPTCAQLDFFQAQNRKDQLMKYSTTYIMKFSTIAGGIGAAPIPIPDSIILTPLQIMMVALIGGLSCREVSKETAMEFFGAMGLNIGAALVMKETARQIVKLIPVAGWAASGAIASTGTFAIGKAAEAYYFNNEVLSISDLMKKAPKIGKASKATKAIKE